MKVAAVVVLVFCIWVNTSYAVSWEQVSQDNVYSDTEAGLGSIVLGNEREAVSADYVNAIHAMESLNDWSRQWVVDNPSAKIREFFSAVWKERDALIIDFAPHLIPHMERNAQKAN